MVRLVEALKRFPRAACGVTTRTPATKLRVWQLLSAPTLLSHAVSPSSRRGGVQRGTHRSSKELASIRTWIAVRNGNPLPFVWHKTSDQTLESLAAYGERISDSDPREAL